MHPIVKLTVDGKAVAGAFYERLVSLTVTDKEGIKSDTFEAELDDGPPEFLEIPRKGAVVVPSLGYEETGVQTLGKFTVDGVNGKCLPYSMSISGKAADLANGKLKEPKERHWEKKKLGDVVGQIADEAKLKVAIDESIKNIDVEWVAQQDESDIHFLERLAGRHNALFTVKDGHLVFTQRGSGKSASGKELPVVIITPKLILEGTCTFELSDRTKHKKVVAYYHDKDKVKRVERETEEDSEGEATFRIPTPFHNAAEADAAAESKAKQLKRGEGSCSVTIVGNPYITAGMKMQFQDVRPGLDDVEFTIETATHKYDKSSGYTLQLDGKIGEGEKNDGKPKSKKAKKKKGSKKKKDGGPGEIVNVAGAPGAVA